MTSDLKNWKIYEKDIYSLLTDQFPDSVVKSNISITGRYSNRKRQIDVLVEGFSGGRKFRQLVECKYYNKKINIKIVESILGFLDDVAADRAIIITNKGYTKSAYKRAHNDPRFVELQICSFDELKDHQGLYAICFRGKNGLIIKAPIGWVTDNNHLGNGTICNLYLRGKNINESAKYRDLIMVNIFNKNYVGYKNLMEFQKDRNKKLKQSHNSAEISQVETINRFEGEVNLDRIIIPEKGLQFSGYIEFEDFVVTIDMMTYLEQESSRLPVIEQILFEVKPYQTEFKNDIDAALWNISRTYNSVEMKKFKRQIFDQIKQLIDEIKEHHPENKNLVNKHFKGSQEVLDLLK